jgi:hypothetical protein
MKNFQVKMSLQNGIPIIEFDVDYDGSKPVQRSSYTNDSGEVKYGNFK